MCINARLFLFVVFSIGLILQILFLFFSNFIRFEDGLQIEFDLVNTISLVFLIFAIIGVAGTLLKNAIMLLIICVVAVIFAD
ncbi:hypothetical protein GCK32_011504 [Trichostrongylus colubriformis]|uniref:Uncharacterized protein n=1 Tax=Trichostrongylus colubriformis TaxID=6319 RepID=A0AAN8FWG2_TRICO